MEKKTGAELAAAWLIISSYTGEIPPRPASRAPTMPAPPRPTAQAAVPARLAPMAPGPPTRAASAPSARCLPPNPRRAGVVAARLPVAVPAQGRPSYFSQRLQPHGQAPSAAHHAAAQPRAPSAAWLSCALCRAERNNRLRAEQLARTAEARGRAQLRAALEVRQAHEQERRAVTAELGALERELRDLVRDRECVRARATH